MKVLTFIVLAGISYYAYTEYNKQNNTNQQPNVQPVSPQNVTDFKNIHYDNPSKYPHEKVYNPKSWQDNEIFNGAFGMTSDQKHFQVMKPRISTF